MKQRGNGEGFASRERRDGARGLQGSIAEISLANREVDCVTCCPIPAAFILLPRGIGHQHFPSLERQINPRRFAQMKASRFRGESFGTSAESGCIRENVTTLREP